MSFSSDYTTDGEQIQRAPSFSLSSGLMTPSELALNALSQNNEERVADTMQTLSDKLDSIQQNETATSTALPDSGAQLSQRQVRKTMQVSGPNNSVERRIYRENWTLPEEMRPYDLVIQ